MAYDPRIIAAIEQRAARIKDPKTRERLRRAAGQIAIVESGVRNLNYGDADSKNYRQERESIYGSQWAKTGGPLNTEAITNRLFNELAQFDRGQPSWQLAADVQRPAAQYRGRYKDVASQAATLFGGASSSAPAASLAGAPSAATPSILAGGQASDFTSLLSPLLERPAAPPSTPLQAPRLSASLKLPEGFGGLAPSATPATQQQDPVSDALGLAAALGGTGATIGSPDAPVAADGPEAEPIAQTVRADRARPRGARGQVVVAPGANRDGAGLSKPLLDFVRQVAGVYGKPLTIGTGTNHNQFVAGTNRESAHWSGNGADLPSSGRDLVKRGRAALIAAGMPRAEAVKQTGGLYNVGRFQVIFATNEGGNHFDHLHVGVRG